MISGSSASAKSSFRSIFHCCCESCDGSTLLHSTWTTRYATHVFKIPIYIIFQISNYYFIGIIIIIIIFLVIIEKDGVLVISEGGVATMVNI